MTRDELLQLHEQTCEAARGIMTAKNQDYTANKGDDPFANFKASAFIGVEPEIGVLMRCMDKFKRIESFARNGTLAVKTESVDDAIQDVINYMILLQGLTVERREQVKSVEA